MDNVVKDKSFSFAKRIIDLYKYLCKEKNEYILSKQILRSGTGIGANITEAQYAISKKDFNLKMYIALKESAETLYWLELLKAGEYISEKAYKSISENCTELIKMLTSITKSAKNE